MLKYFKPISSTTVSSSTSSSSSAGSTGGATSTTALATAHATVNNSTHLLSSTLSPTSSPRRGGGKKRTAEEIDNLGSPAQPPTTTTSLAATSTTTTRLSATDQEALAIANKEKELLEVQGLTSPTAQAQLELLRHSQPAIDLTGDNDTETVSTQPKMARILASSSAATSSSSLSAKVSLPSTIVSTDEENAILAQFGLDRNSSWAPVVLAEIRKPYFTKLLKFVTDNRKSKPNTIYPPQNQVFSALSLTPLDNVKVVILGQDPYHGPGQAHGLAFSVPKGIALPPSLVNILKEVDADINGSTSSSSSSTPKAKHGNLEYWARQGVLLLNSVLTVEDHKPFSHAKQGWETFTGAILKAVAERKEKVVFLCWGGPAQERAKFISRTRHYVLEAPHPSPLSVYRGFSGCKHFSKTNTYLQQQGKAPIDWSLEKA